MGARLRLMRCQARSTSASLRSGSAPSRLTIEFRFSGVIGFLALLAMPLGSALAQPDEALQADIDAVRECLTVRDNACLLEIGLRLSEDPILDAAIAQQYAERGDDQRSEEIFDTASNELFGRPPENFSRSNQWS